MRPITASGLQRAAECGASLVLEGAPASSADAEAGDWKHRYLETGDLASVPEEYREACEKIDLEALPEGSSEITLAWHPETGETQWLGRLPVSRGYPYEPGWVYGTADRLQTRKDHVEVYDFKTGHGFVPHARENLQLGFLAMAACEHLHFTSAKVGIVRVREDGSSYMESEARLGVFELADVRRMVREIAARQPSREDVHEGWWCKYCECFTACPAKQRTVALALAEQGPVELTQETAPLFLERLETLKAVVKKAEDVARSYVEIAGPVRVGDRTYGPVTRESVVSGKALAVLGQRLGLDAVREAQKTSTSKADIERVAKARGLNPAQRRELLEEIRKAGGIEPRAEIRWH